MATMSHNHHVCLLSGEESFDIRECTYHVLACPATPPSNKSQCPKRQDGDEQIPDLYCACGYRGVLCATCDTKFYVSWAGDSCENCDDTKSHVPTIGLAACLVMLGLAVVVAIGLQRKAIQSSTGFQRFKHVKRVGAVKFQILFYTAQVPPCQNSTVFEQLRLPSIS